jgi:hypothetical protein
VDTDGVRHCIDQLRVEIGLQRWPAEVHIQGTLGDRNKTRVYLAPPTILLAGSYVDHVKSGTVIFSGRMGAVAAIEQLE